MSQNQVYLGEKFFNSNFFASMLIVSVFWNRNFKFSQTDEKTDHQFKLFVTLVRTFFNKVFS